MKQRIKNWLCKEEKEREEELNDPDVSDDEDGIQFDTGNELDVNLQ